MSGEGEGEGEGGGHEVTVTSITISSEPAVSAGGKNAKSILCQQCPSLILSPESATFVQMDYSLPRVTQKLVLTGPVHVHVEKEDLRDYWSVEDMYTFENAGFTNTDAAENVKYLSCADCESGPIGYVNLDTKVSYVAHARVRYQ